MVAHLLKTQQPLLAPPWPRAELVSLLARMLLDALVEAECYC